MSEETSTITILSHTIQELEKKTILLEANLIGIQQELIDLQVEYTHQQDHIQILDQVIVELRTHLESLQRNVDVLEEKLQSSQQENTDFSLQEEKPPHY